MNKYIKGGQAKLAEFGKNESGATAIEYGLIAAIVAIGCIVAFQGLSNQIQTAFDGISTSLGNTINDSVTGKTSEAGSLTLTKDLP